MNAPPCLLILGQLSDAFSPLVCAAMRKEACVVEVPIDADLRKLLHHVTFDSVLDVTGAVTAQLVLHSENALTSSEATLKVVKH
ncbi:MAG: hypothetical protein ACI81R_002041 [Bradymonadia bacterium]|jgi:hypothetical protein